MVDLTRIIARYAGPIQLHLVPFTQIQLTIYEQCPPKETTVLMRRLMMRIAEAWAKQDGSRALITGEALGQVASQTIESLCVTDDAVSMPVFRPLIGFDKEEIIAIAKRSILLKPPFCPMRIVVLYSCPSTRSPNLRWRSSGRAKPWWIGRR